MMDFPASERTQYLLKPGDLLINEGGAGIGRAAIWRGQLDECYFQKSVLRLRPIGHTSPEWMVECMRVAVAQKVLLVEGNLATIPHVPAEALRIYRFPFPPADDQNRLLSWLAKQRQHDRRMLATIERQIELLVEHRQALITSAVIGDLSVPVVAA
jgi:type I restriction enzyme S subunit